MSEAEALSLDLNYSGTQVRMVGTADHPEWVLSDVCEVLGIADHTTATRDFPSDCKGTQTVRTPGGLQEVSTVTEPGLYRLIGRSRKPEAEKFQRFVFHEVLPSIRKFGRYPAPGAMTVAAKTQEWSVTRTEFVEIIEGVVNPRFDALESKMESRFESIDRHLERVPATRKEIPEHTKQQALAVIEKDLNGKCPNCLETPIMSDGIPLPNLRWDHKTSRGLVGPEDVWPVDEECNYDLGEPGSLQRSKTEHRFRTFQDYRRIRFGDGHKTVTKQLVQPGQLAFRFKS